MVVALVLAGLTAAPVIAKPISYVGGTMIMQENDETGYTLTVDHTLTPKVAIGFFGKKVLALVVITQGETPLVRQRELAGEVGDFAQDVSEQLFKPHATPGGQLFDV